MGTHPIFESDFDCLTDSIKMAELNMNESHKVLESNGLYVDDLSRVRVVDPEIADASDNTKAATDNFVADFKDFITMISDFSKQADSVAEQVKQRKMRAIGTRTQIQAIDRENSAKKVFRQGCQLLYLNNIILESITSKDCRESGTSRTFT